MLGELHRRERGVVSADGDELRDVEPQQRLDRVLEQRRALRRIRARDADVRAAAEMNAADAFDRERDDVIDVPLHDPFEPVAQSDDVDALQPGADRRRGDDAVETRGGAAPAENCELVVGVHVVGIVISRAEAVCNSRRRFPRIGDFCSQISLEANLLLRRTCDSRKKPSARSSGQPANARRHPQATGRRNQAQRRAVGGAGRQRPRPAGPSASLRAAMCATTRCASASTPTKWSTSSAACSLNGAIAAPSASFAKRRKSSRTISTGKICRRPRSAAPAIAPPARRPGSSGATRAHCSPSPSTRSVALGLGFVGVLSAFAYWPSAAIAGVSYAAARDVHCSAAVRPRGLRVDYPTLNRSRRPAGSSPRAPKARNPPVFARSRLFLISSRSLLADTTAAAAKRSEQCR